MSRARARDPRAPSPVPPRSREPRLRSSAAGGAGPGKLAEARPPRPPVPEAQRARPRGTASGSPSYYPPPPRTLKSLPLRSTPRTNGSTPVASMVGAALRQAGRTLGGREPRAGSAPAPPLQPARASSRPRPLREGQSGGSGSSRPRPAQTSRELGDRRGLRESGTPAGGVRHLRSPVAASRVGSRQCRLGGCSLGSGP